MNIRRGLIRICIVLTVLLLLPLAIKATADKLQVQGIVPRLMSAAEYRAFVVAEAEKFGKIVQQANIKLQN